MWKTGTCTFLPKKLLSHLTNKCRVLFLNKVFLFLGKKLFIIPWIISVRWWKWYILLYAVKHLVQTREFMKDLYVWTLDCVDHAIFGYVFVFVYASCIYFYLFWLLRISRWLSGKESACQCRKCMFGPWVGKIPWRRKWQPIPVFCLRNPLTGAWESDTTEQKAESTVLNSRGSWRTLAYLENFWHLEPYVKTQTSRNPK